MTIARTERSRWSERAKSYARSLEADFEVTATEEITLVEVCRGISRLDAIAEEMAGHNLTTVDRWGQTVTHPLVTESRMLSQAVAKLMGSLRVPDVEVDSAGKRTEKPGSKKPRRVQTRGTYAPPNLAALPGGLSR